MSDKHHPKTVAPPLRLIQIEFLRLPLSSWPQSSSESFTVRVCLQDVEPLLLGSKKNIYIYILHNYVVASLLTIVFATLIFLISYIGM